MTLRTLKRKCEQIQEGVPGLIDELKLRFNSRSERWQRSQKGRDLKQDIRIVKTLLDNVQEFTDTIDHVKGEEE